MNKNRQEESRLAYSKIATNYKQLFINELRNKPLDKKLYDLFYDKVINKGKVLEIGCGPGEISNYLWMKGLDITGIDYSPEMIKAAKEYNNEIEFIVGDVFKLNFDNESIDAIVAPYLIVNFDIDEVKETFNEMNRVLKRSGVLLVTFHIGDDEDINVDNFIVENNKLSFTFFKIETIKTLLLETGFKITETVIKEPYDGEKTTRAFIFCVKI